MSSNKPTVASLMLSLLVALCPGLPYPSHAEGAVEGASWPVGAVIPLTGDLAYFGTAVRRGIEMALRERSQHPVTIIFDDDHSGDRKVTINAIRSIAARSGARVFILSGMPSVVVADPIVRKANFIAFSAWDSNRQIDRLSENTFGFGWSNERTAASIATFAHDVLKARTAALIAGNDEWSEIMAGAFADRFRSRDGTMVMTERVNLDDTDFRSLVLKVRRAAPNVVYFPLYGPSLLSLARQIKEGGYSGNLMSAETMSDNEIRQLGSFAEGLYVTQAHLDNREFEARYKAQFKLQNLDVNLAHVALGFDLYQFICACVEAAAANSVTALRQAIRTVTLGNGLLGATSFNGGRIVDREQQVMSFRNGRLSEVK